MRRTMKRKVMPSKEHVRELRCERSKQGHIATNLINMTKKTCKSVFFKELVFVFHLKILSKKWMDVYSTPLPLN